MVKNSVRLTGFLFALFALLLSWQYTINEQQQFPFHTAVRFELNLSNSGLLKEDIVDALNRISERNHVVLVKVATDRENYEHKKDVIWFGAQEPAGKEIIVEGQKIYWLDSKYTGELISSKNIGSRPLFGVYTVSESLGFRDELSEWANQNGISVLWYLRTPMLKVLYDNLQYQGIGNATLTAFLLFLTTLIGWFVAHAKARAVRFLGGVSCRRIHAEDTVAVLKTVMPGFIAAVILVLTYIAFTNSIKQVSLMIDQSLLTLLILVLLAGLFALSISKLVQPRTEHLAARKIPLKRFRRIGTCTRVLSMILSLVIIPSTIYSAYILHSLSEEYVLWEKMQNYVSLSFNDLSSMETEDTLPDVEAFFSDIDRNKNLCLSMVVDKAIMLNEEEYGGYDHIIVTDRAWVDSFSIGVEAEDTNGQLHQISFEGLAKPLQDFLNTQIPIWTKTGEVQPAKLGYYEFTGDKFLALSPNVGYGGSTVQAENPLVILVDGCTSVLVTAGFILPAASSGNVLFTDEEGLRKQLTASSITEYVVSIDTIVDVALEQAQKFGREGAYYVAACVLAFFAMIFAGILEAQLWAEANKKRIFTLHTFGQTYHEIIQFPFRKGMMVATITVIAGSICAFMLKYPQPVILFVVAVCVILLYGVTTLIAYKVCVSKTFLHMSQRNEP